MSEQIGYERNGVRFTIMTKFYCAPLHSESITPATDEELALAGYVRALTPSKVEPAAEPVEPRPITSREHDMYAKGYEDGKAAAEPVEGRWVRVEGLPALVAAGEQLRTQLADVCPGCTTYIEDWDSAIADVQSLLWLRPMEDPPEHGTWAWIVYGESAVQYEPWEWVFEDGEDGEWVNGGHVIGADEVSRYMPIHAPPAPDGDSSEGE